MTNTTYYGIAELDKDGKPVSYLKAIAAKEFLGRTTLFKASKPRTQRNGRIEWARPGSEYYEAWRQLRWASVNLDTRASVHCGAHSADACQWAVAIDQTSRRQYADGRAG